MALNHSVWPQCCLVFVALAKALYDLKDSGDSVISLEQLAVPFSRHIAEHLVVCDKQITSASSKFLDGCRDFNAKQINQDALIDLTVQLGFNNVLYAFHNVHTLKYRPVFLWMKEKPKAALLLYSFPSSSLGTRRKIWLIWCWPVLIAIGA